MKPIAGETTKVVSVKHWEKPRISGRYANAGWSLLFYSRLEPTVVLVRMEMRYPRLPK